MSDLMIAGLLLGLLVGLAIAAPIWGVDSRDGVDSDQSARRVAWLHRHTGGQPRPATNVALAGVLRRVALRLDADLAGQAQPERRLAEAI